MKPPGNRALAGGNGSLSANSPCVLTEVSRKSKERRSRARPLLAILQPPLTHRSAGSAGANCSILPVAHEEDAPPHIARPGRAPTPHRERIPDLRTVRFRAHTTFFTVGGDCPWVSDPLTESSVWQASPSWLP